MTEAELLQQVTQLAELLGWQWVHFRPARTQHGWRTPVSGPLGKGWPDLVLVRRDRLVWMELKVGRGKLTAEQDSVALILANTGHAYYVVRDLDAAHEVLR